MSRGPLFMALVASSWAVTVSVFDADPTSPNCPVDVKEAAWPLEPPARTNTHNRPSIQEGIRASLEKLLAEIRAKQSLRA